MTRYLFTSRYNCLMVIPMVIILLMVGHARATETETGTETAAAYTPEECIEAGFASDFVHSVVERVRRNHFKRILPPIAKLSNRTIGYDYLYLRDWGT